MLVLEDGFSPRGGSARAGFAVGRPGGGGGGRAGVRQSGRFSWRCNLLRFWEAGFRERGAVLGSDIQRTKGIHYLAKHTKMMTINPLKYRNRISVYKSGSRYGFQDCTITG